MNRDDFQKLANLRIKEAKVLLDNRYYAGSYYLAGYAIECALKACIAKRTKRYEFPPPKEVVGNIYTHKPETLLVSANLWAAFKTDMQSDPTLANYWLVVKGWSVEQRYEMNITESMARDIYKAVTDRRHGVLTWLKKRW
jgi:HEPN domain-containing protein